MTWQEIAQPFLQGVVIGWLVWNLAWARKTR